jgi:hypothetical protein
VNEGSHFSRSLVESQDMGGWPPFLITSNHEGALPFRVHCERVGAGAISRASAEAQKRACQIPAYQAYPLSGDADPRPLPNFFRLSVTVRCVMNFTLL